MSEKLTFKICIGDLAAYNNGILVYTWVDLLTLNYEKIIETKNKLLEEGTALVTEHVYEGNESLVHPHEEWHIQDYSNNLGIVVNEYTSLEKLCAFVDKIKPIDKTLLEKVYEAKDFEIDEVIDESINFEDYHYIEARDERTLGEITFNEFYGDPVELIENLTLLRNHSKGVLKLLAKHFDYEGYGRNLVHSGQYIKVTDGYLVNYGE